MPRPLVRQTIADNELTVASSLETLMAEMDIDTSLVIDTEVVPFGSNRFLIVLTFFGVWTWRAYAGLKSAVARAFGISRGASPTLGETPVVARGIAVGRGLSPTAGGTPVIGRAMTILRSADAVLLGLVSAAATVWNDLTPNPSEGLVVSNVVNIGINLQGSPAEGLVVSVSYVLSG